MKEIGANTSVIERFVSDIENSSNYRQTINGYKIHENLKSFMNFTFDIIESGEVHKIVGIYFWKRECHTGYVY